MSNEFYKIFAIAVMLDHVHWLIQPLQKSENEYWSLSSIMHSIKSYSAKQIPKVMKHIGTVWQVEWHDRIIRDEQEFENTWEYIRQNPVKADLCEQPEDYPFLWQLSNPVAQAPSLQSMQDDRANGSRQDACPTDANSNPVAQASSLPIIEEEYDPDTTTTMSRGVGKCPNCGSVVQDDIIKNYAQTFGLGHQLYAVSFRKGQTNLEFRLPQKIDIEASELAFEELQELQNSSSNIFIPDVHIPYSNRVYERDAIDKLGLTNWKNFFNPRQLLTLATYAAILNEAKEQLRLEYESEKAERSQLI